jgi:hypothetical protein
MPPADPKTTADLPATLREYRAATHGNLTATLTAAASEIERLRFGWLRSIQAENSCAATGKPCRDPCACVLEQVALMEADNGK